MTLDRAQTIAAEFGAKPLPLGALRTQEWIARVGWLPSATDINLAVAECDRLVDEEWTVKRSVPASVALFGGAIAIMGLLIRRKRIIAKA